MEENQINGWSLFWLNVKKYWKIAALVIGVVVMYILVRGQRTNFAEKLKEINDAHDQETRRINEIRERERKEYEQNRKQYEARIEQIKAQYEKQLAELDKKTRKRVDEIMVELGDDPEALARELSRKMGFQVEVFK